jgi:hypothetical protein
MDRLESIEQLEDLRNGKTRKLLGKGFLVVDPHYISVPFRDPPHFIGKMLLNIRIQYGRKDDNLHHQIE